MQHDSCLHKVHAQGNDFILIPQKLHQAFNCPERIRWLANRRFGIGCDQVFFIDIDDQQTRWYCKIFNQDGSSARFCLNGIYAAACFIQKRYPHVAQWYIHTDHQVYQAHNQKKPSIQIPNTHTLQAKQISKYLETPSLEAHYIQVSNEHLLIDQKHTHGISLLQIGSQLQNHPDFPDGINVSFYHYATENTVHLTTYERGSGLTYSCGSAGLAAALLHWQTHNTKKQWTIKHPGGCSFYQQQPSSITMHGQYYYVASFNSANYQHPEKFPAPLSV